MTCGSPLEVKKNPITTAEFANRKMAVFDLDMTLLDNRQRFTDAVRAGIVNKDGSPKHKGSWKKRGEFLYQPNRLAKDKLMPNAMNLIEHLMEDGYVIAYCTARPIMYYEVTKDQLEDKGLPLFQDSTGSDLLFCKRSVGQKTPLYKADVVRKLQAQYDVRLFFDDKPENLSAALKVGVPGVYQTIGEYYGMIKGVKKNPHPTFIDEKGFPKYDPDAEPYASAASHIDDPSGMGREMLRIGKNPKGMSKAEIKAKHPPGTSQAHIDKMKELMDQGMEFGPAHNEAERLGFKAMSNPHNCGCGQNPCITFGTMPRSNPIKRGRDGKGPYMRWGDKGKKYHYKAGNKSSREKARKKAHMQASAAFAGGYRGKYNPGNAMKVKDILIDEGGASGLKPLMKAFPKGTSEKKAREMLKTVPDVYLHPAGDYILMNPGHIGAIPDGIVGKHCILELYDCDPKILDDEKLLRKTLTSAAKGANMELLDFVSHEFEPKGVTALALLGESHISIHTWPELEYAMVDVLTCGEKSRPVKACDIICKGLRAKNHTLKFFMRETPAYREMVLQNPEEYSEDYMVPRDIDKLGKAADSMEATYHEGIEVPEWWKSKLSVTADKADNLSDALGYVADNPSHVLKIYSGEPKSKFVNKGAIFAEVQIGRNVGADVGEVVQSIYRGLVGGRTSLAERRMAMAVASMQKELSDRAEAVGGNAIANLRVDYEIVQGTATLTILAHADAIKMPRKPKSNPPDALGIGRLKPKTYTEEEIASAIELENQKAVLEMQLAIAERDLGILRAELEEEEYRKEMADDPRSNPPKSKVEKGKELYKHMNGKAPAKTETKVIDIGDVWYQVGEGGCWSIGYMSGKETGSSNQKYVHNFNEETKNGDFPKLYATIPDKGKPMLIITGGTWKIKTDEEGVAWIYD
tara:strand:- start:5134 stop:7884 length:2751 start_codon:yes stop_codon:yes gene_type:complete